MKNNKEISDNEKWQAVIGSSEKYDGLFYYGVRTTGIFCRPSCRAKTPLKKNIAFYSSPKEAIAAGLRPCKRCRPDIEAFQPEVELVNRAKELLSVNYNRPMNLKEIAKALGVSVNHLIRLFKGVAGITPMSFIINIRVERALLLLKETDMKIIDIAYSTGFTSMSNFYRALRKAGITPHIYRNGKNN